MPRIEMPIIDLSKCNGCGLCIDVCRCQAIIRVDGVVTVVETEACGWCLQCELVCPTGAIVCPYHIITEK